MANVMHERVSTGFACAHTHTHLHTDSLASLEISLPEFNLDKLTALKY